MNRHISVKSTAIILGTLVVGAVSQRQARADAFQVGEFVTWSQVALGTFLNDGQPTGPVTEAVLQDFDAAFASSNDLMEIGIPGAAGKSIIFDNPESVITFLPATGAPGPLTADLLDPAISSGGSYAGEVADLTLVTAFNRAGFFIGTSDFLLQNLVLTGLTGDELWANGLNIGGALAEADVVLGGGPLPNNKTDLLAVFTLINNIDMAFDGGQTVTAWADQHLEIPTSSGGMGSGGTTAAPEIDSGGTTSAMTLLLGVLAVMRNRRRSIGP